MQSIQWKNLDVVGCSRYSVSTNGDVRHLSSGRPKNPSTNQYGIKYVGLTTDSGRQRSFPVASLVAYAFIEADPQHPERDTIIYKDGDKSNCSVENLAYRTRSYAIRYNKYLSESVTPQDTEHYTIESEEPEGGSKVFYNVLDCAMEYGILPEDIKRSIYLGIPLRIMDGIQFYEL